MSRDQRIAAAIRRLCDAAGVSTDWQRKEIEGILGKWIDNEPTIEAEHAKDDQLYWVRTPGSDWKRKAFRIGVETYSKQQAEGECADIHRDDPAVHFSHVRRYTTDWEEA